MKNKYRYENFGGIISSEDPPFLAFVDRNFMMNINGGETSELWGKDETIGILSAPTEVHFAVTNKCSVKCGHCYMDSGEALKSELDTSEFKKAIDIISEMQIFHIAMGGGEALERNDLFDLALYAREKGLVPNLTVSGRGIDRKTAKKMKIFGQVNVSVDGIFGNYSVFRNSMNFAEADNALFYLTDEGIPAGINCVLGKKNFDDIEELFIYAKRMGLNEIEFLRLKPSGRSLKTFLKRKTTYDQNIKLIPLLSDLSQRYSVTAKIDCSFVPMLCYHSPPEELLYSMATYGCEAGNVLLGIKSDGSVSGCSFLDPSGISVFDLKDKFTDSFQKERNVNDGIEEPCSSCAYLNICKGGCHAVSFHISKDYSKPDPFCPIVEEYNLKKKML